MSTTSCRWGRECKRADCWFAHPEGRAIDTAPIPAGRGAPVAAAATPAATGGPTPCRFGRKCHRPDCYYPHPDGREIDESPKAASSGAPSATASAVGDEECACCGGNPFECETPECAERGQCGCTFGMGLDEDDEDDEGNIVQDDTWKDEWFADSRNCPCCKGYIYRCEQTQAFCGSGECFCTQSAETTGAVKDEAKVMAPGGPAA